MIHFRKPDFKRLKRRGWKMYDFHVHTKYSYDAFAEPQELLEKAASLGVGFSITDHNDIRGVMEIYNNDLGVEVIPGIELMSQETVEVLAYFKNIGDLERFYNIIVKPNMHNDGHWQLDLPLLDIVREAKNRFDCVLSAPHPSITGSNITNLVTRKEVLKYLDCCEAINGQIPHFQNRRALRWYRKMKRRLGRRSLLGGSDCHTVDQFGRVITCLKPKRSLRNISRLHNEESSVFEMMTKGRHMVIGTENTTWRSFPTYLIGQVSAVFHFKLLKRIWHKLTT